MEKTTKDIQGELSHLSDEEVKETSTPATSSQINIKEVIVFINNTEVKISDAKFVSENLF